MRCCDRVDGVQLVTREIGLVSCVKTKQDSAAIPKALYTSSYFEKMRSYAEEYHDEWFILSAEHGLLRPEGDPIEPCDFTLRDVSRAERREWAQQVFEELDDQGLLEEDTTLVIHAGKLSRTSPITRRDASLCGDSYGGTSNRRHSIVVHGPALSLRLSSRRCNPRLDRT